MLSPNPHYYEIQGRAAEIARAHGSPVGTAEHLFLGMLHDGGWPMSVISDLVDPGQAEAAVLAILGSPDREDFCFDVNNSFYKHQNPSRSWSAA